MTIGRGTAQGNRPSVDVSLQCALKSGELGIADDIPVGAGGAARVTVSRRPQRLPDLPALLLFRSKSPRCPGFAPPAAGPLWAARPRRGTPKT
jgi:hypothetical protein